jgi:putative lipoprotein
MTRFIAAFLLIILGGPAMADQPLGSLAGSEWRLIRLNADPVEEVEAWIAFKSKGRVIGTSGCNQFTGAFTEGEAFAIGPLAATRKACLGPAMQLETRFFGALSAARDVVATHLMLEMFDESGASLAQFARADFD